MVGWLIGNDIEVKNVGNNTERGVNQYYYNFISQTDLYTLFQ